jgi:hypothetical protein
MVPGLACHDKAHQGQGCDKRLCEYCTAEIFVKAMVPKDYCVLCFANTDTRHIDPVLGLCADCCERFKDYPIDDYDSVCTLEEMASILGVKLTKWTYYPGCGPINVTQSITSLMPSAYHALKGLQEHLIDGLIEGYGLNVEDTDDEEDAQPDDLMM